MHEKEDETMAMKVKPLHDRILVQRIEEKEQKRGSIIIPDTAKEKPMEGKVIAVGAGRLEKDGKRIPLEVKVGDRVLFTSYAGEQFDAIDPVRLPAFARLDRDPVPVPADAGDVVARREDHQALEVTGSQSEVGLAPFRHDLVEAELGLAVEPGKNGQ